MLWYEILLVPNFYSGVFWDASVTMPLFLLNEAEMGEQE